MVIQAIMSPADIVGVWEVTSAIFTKYNIPLTKQPLKTLVKDDQIPLLLQELNASVGSSTATCIEGG